MRTFLVGTCALLVGGALLFSQPASATGYRCAKAAANLVSAGSKAERAAEVARIMSKYNASVATLTGSKAVQATEAAEAVELAKVLSEYTKFAPASAGGKAVRATEATEGVNLAKNLSEYGTRVALPPSDVYILKSLDLYDIGLLQRIKVRLKLNKNVARFGDDFMEGARDPKHYMKEVSKERPELHEYWNSVPEEKRIFLIGAGKDKEQIQRLTKKFGEQGLAVFFYKACAKGVDALCTSKQVGAFFASAGKVKVVSTRAAEGSAYVTQEVMFALDLLGQNRTVVLYSFRPQALLNARLANLQNFDADAIVNHSPNIVLRVIPRDAALSHDEPERDCQQNRFYELNELKSKQGLESQEYQSALAVFKFEHYRLRKKKEKERRDEQERRDLRNAGLPQSFPVRRSDMPQKIIDITDQAARRSKLNRLKSKHGLESQEYRNAHAVIRFEHDRLREERQDLECARAIQ